MHHPGSHLCFADETGQSLRPPRRRTPGAAGQRPQVRVAGRSRGRVNIAGVVCFMPGPQARLFFKLLVHHGRRSEQKSIAWTDYRDLIVVTHLQLDTPVVWLWDNVNVHLQQEMFDFTEKHKD
ncbi:hypothetical protein [Streptomyces sp. B5E4]|uniref:hypothetical protein n=1 Tax=Streptomyces sp. B5E4 TaxID=3153568 RepID=UPI00325E71B4